MNSKTRDIRIKFEAAPDQVERLHAYFGQKQHLKAPPYFESRHFTYYDTKELAVRGQGYSVRLREGAQPILQLVATPNGAAYRYFEDIRWENAMGPQPGPPPEIKAEILPSYLSDEIGETLHPAFSVKTETRRYVVTHGSSEIEVIVADGSVSAESRSAGFVEVQFFVDSEEPSDLFSYILGVDEIVPLKLGTKTEASSGYRLFQGKTKLHVKRDEIKLDRSMSCADAFRIIVHECLQHVVANEPGMSAGDAEALHQVRIGLRRLRTALSLFSQLCTDTQVRTIKTEIKWLNTLLSPARDLDVFLSEVMLPLREQYREEPGLLSLQRTYSAQRTKMYDRVSQAVNSIRFRSLILETAAWVESGLWNMNQSEGGKQARERLIENFAIEELSRRRKKAKKRGAGLAKLGPDDRHSLRIHVKKLRYASEFFMSLFPGKRKNKRVFLASLKDLQAALGSVNDIAVRAGLKADIITDKKSRANFQKSQHRAFAAGLIIGHQRAKIESLVKMAERSYADFLDAKPFWQGYETKLLAKQPAGAEKEQTLDLFSGEAA